MLKNYKQYAATGRMADVFAALLIFFFVLSSLAASEENCTRIIVDFEGSINPSSTPKGVDPLIDSDRLNNSSEAATSALPDTARYIIMGLAGIVASIIGILGIILLYKNYGAFVTSSESDDEPKDDAAKSDYLMRRTVGMILGIVMVLSCVWMLLYFFNMQMGAAPQSSGTAGLLSLILPVLLAILVFGAVLLMCAMHARLKDQEVGSMRKTIAGLLVLGLMVVVFASLFGEIKNGDIITQYIQLVGVIIAFYFGSRVAGVAGENAAGMRRNLPAGAAGQNPPPGGDGSGQEDEGKNENVSEGDGNAETGQGKDQNAGAV